MYKIGMIVEGVVTGVQPYGAFVSLNGEIQGLIHISEVKHGFIKNINDVLDVNQRLTVQIIDIDEYSGKISLSLRSLEEQVVPPVHQRKKYFTNRKKKIGFHSLAEQMPIWTSDTLELLQEN